MYSLEHWDVKSPILSLPVWINKYLMSNYLPRIKVYLCPTEHIFSHRKLWNLSTLDLEIRALLCDTFSFGLAEPLKMNFIIYRKTNIKTSCIYNLVLIQNFKTVTETRLIWAELRVPSLLSLAYLSKAFSQWAVLQLKG